MKTWVVQVRAPGLHGWVRWQAGGRDIVMERDVAVRVASLYERYGGRFKFRVKNLGAEAKGDGGLSSID